MMVTLRCIGCNKKVEIEISLIFPMIIASQRCSDCNSMCFDIDGIFLPPILYKKLFNEWGYHAPTEGKENLPKIECYIGNSDYIDKKKRTIINQLKEIGCKESSSK